MKATTTKFELRTFLTNNREMVIENYNELKNETFFNGITLKNFMIEIFNAMLENEIRSEKRANTMLPLIVGEAYVSNSKVSVKNDLDQKLVDKYRGTAFMALV